MLVCALKPFELFEYSHLQGDNRDENAAEDKECLGVICTRASAMVSSGRLTFVSSHSRAAVDRALR